MSRSLIMFAVCSAVALAALASSGCKAIGLGSDDNKAPTWVTQFPKKEGLLISAVGSASRTLRKEDGKQYAIDNALKILAANIRTEIQSGTVSTIEGSHETFSMWTEANTTGAVANSEVVETWYDADGQISGGDPGTWYAWVRTSLSSQ
jgi:hypothetical protein